MELECGSIKEIHSGVIRKAAIFLEGCRNCVKV